VSCSLLLHHYAVIQSCHRSHVAHIFYHCSVWYFVTCADPNMIHCLHQQPLARTVRTPHLHKPVLSGSSLTPTSNLLDRSYTQANTGFSLFGRTSQHGVLVVWPLPAIASGSCLLAAPYAVQLPPLRRVLPLQGTCCWYAEAKPFSVWPNQCF